MPSWWDRLKGKIGRKSEPRGKVAARVQKSLRRADPRPDLGHRQLPVGGHRSGAGWTSRIILIARSWTGKVATLAQVRREHDELIIEALRVENSSFASIGDPIDVIACALGHVATAEALLDVGANPDARADGTDALAIAIEQEKPEIVALLNRRSGRP
jgi:hypothetical protein